MAAELPADEIDDLRNDIAAMYDEVRGLLVRLPIDDRRHATPAGREIQGATARLLLSPIRDARRARRLADGHAGVSFGPGRLLDLIADWRLQHALSRATRRDLLAVWERGFNELFSSLNDVAEQSLEVADKRGVRAMAIGSLRGTPDRVADRIAEVRRLIEDR